jgi:hypothetical protein
MQEELVNYPKYLERVMLSALQDAGFAHWMSAQTICWRSRHDQSKHYHLTVEVRPADYEHEGKKP